MTEFKPLPHEFMLIGIIGFFISALYLYKFSLTWSFTLSLFFLIIVIASLISISNASLDEDSIRLIGGEPYLKKSLKILSDKRKKSIEKGFKNKKS